MQRLGPQAPRRFRCPRGIASVFALGVTSLLAGCQGSDDVGGRHAAARIAREAPPEQVQVTTVRRFVTLDGVVADEEELAARIRAALEAEGIEDPIRLEIGDGVVRLRGAVDPAHDEAVVQIAREVIPPSLAVQDLLTRR